MHRACEDSRAVRRHRRRAGCRCARSPACGTARLARGWPLGLRELGRTGDADVPVVPVRRDRFEVDEPREHGGGRLCAPAGQTGKAIGRIADERQVIRDRRRRHAELRDHPRSSTTCSRAAVQLHDARSADALREVFVRRADVNAADARVARRCSRPAANASSARIRPSARRRSRPRPAQPQQRVARTIRGRSLRPSCSRPTTRCGTTR